MVNSISWYSVCLVHPPCFDRSSTQCLSNFAQSQFFFFTFLSIFLKSHFCVPKITLTCQVSACQTLLTVPWNTRYTTCHPRNMQRVTCYINTCLIPRLPTSVFRTIHSKSPESMFRFVQVILLRLSRVTYLSLHKYLGLTKELIKKVGEHDDCWYFQNELTTIFNSILYWMNLISQKYIPLFGRYFALFDSDVIPDFISGHTYVRYEYSRIIMP